ncbi:MAG: 50S ribosomal protein L6 [Deltaproteobacteria bacterium]|nr:50S ribosomal protein L6 [Deltaproteobacteria bacterium]
MSRIGKKPIPVPKGVKIALEGNLVHVEGPKGKLSRSIPGQVQVALNGDSVVVGHDPEKCKDSSFQGLTRTLVANMIDGVTKGFQKELEIVGVGYRAEPKGKVLNLSLGFSHPVEFPIPAGISIEVEKQTKIMIRGADKELVGETAATIRDFRPPEPYKGKGIKYKDERIIRKAGKTGKK